MKEALTVIAGIIFTCFFIYATYWIAKNVSYWLFYEDMVVETIKEMVKLESLK